MIIWTPHQELLGKNQVMKVILSKAEREQQCNEHSFSTQLKSVIFSIVNAFGFTLIKND